MLICTYLAALAGYLFPVKMAQKLPQLFEPRAAHPASACRSEAPWGRLNRGDSGQPPSPPPSPAAAAAGGLEGAQGSRGEERARGLANAWREEN